MTKIAEFATPILYKLKNNLYKNILKLKIYIINNELIINFP